ncbi:MAG: autotransporter-associated beta strand repeat-containing protein, partial [Verrucomicrobiota bacterium]
MNPTTLVLNGVGGILLSNASTTVVMAIVNTNSVNAGLFHLGLANSGIIYANSLNPAQPPTTAGSVEIRNAIIETNGSKGITKTGPGILYLRGTNNYSGATTNLQGDIEVDSVGTIGNGTGTLYLSGGNLQCGLDRSGTTATATAIPNPIMLTADAYIYNKAGNADSTRRLPLSGSLSGTGGTLKIANPTAANNQTFIVRLFGSFTFNRPVEVGQSSGAYADLSGIFNSYSVLELCNSNGVQTFNGDISERGSVTRDNPLNLAAAGGASVFTGNNTYLGGTLISSGTLFANNAAGSALGSGAVTVATNGTLGGNGSVIAATTISLNGSGGTISPGATTSAVANLAVSDLTFGPGAIYNWQISAAAGTAGTAWDLITCSAGWTDAAGGNAVTVKIDSQGLVPTGWNSATAYDWVIVSSGVANSFDPSHFTVDTTLFSGVVNGGFTFSVVGGSLHLKYVPGSDFVINVPSGSQGQTAGYGTITGATNVVKIGNGEVVFDNAANTYGGQTKILAGTLSLSVDALNGSGALGANSSATFLGNTNGTTNATLNISVAAVTDAHNIIVRVGSSGTKTIGTTITSGTATFAGDVALSDNAALTAPA